MLKRPLIFCLINIFLFSGLVEIASAAPAPSTGYSWQTVLDQNNHTLTYSFDTLGGYEVEGLLSQPLNELFVAIPEWRDIIGQALNTWGAAADITFVEVPDNYDAYDAAGAQGMIRFTGHSTPGFLAHAWIPVPTGTTEADLDSSRWGDVHYNTDYSWDSSKLQSTTLHELGHSLGLMLHNLDKESVMFGLGGDNPTILSEHDLADLRAIYFPQNAPAQVLNAPVIAAERDWFAVADGTVEARTTVIVTDRGNILTTGEQKTGIKGIGASLADENYGFDFVDLHLAAGGRIETDGHNAYGIAAGDFNNITVDGLITTAGFSADGVALLGRDNTLQTGAASLIRTSGTSGNGIYAGGDEDESRELHGNVIVANGRIETSGAGACGIYGVGYSNLTLNGSIVTAGNYAAGIGTDQYGHQNIVVNKGASIETNGSFGYGILARGADNMVTMNGAITTTGSNGYGLYGFSTESNNIIINGAITTTGEQAYGLFASGDGNQVENHGTVTTVGEQARGMYVHGDDNRLGNYSSVTTAEEQARGMYASGNENLLVNYGKVTTEGYQAFGLYVHGDDNRLENYSSVTTGGEQAFGLYAVGAGNRLENLGNIVTAGSLGYGLYLSEAGNQGVNAGDIHTEGRLGHGMVARDGGNVLVHSGSIETTGENAYGIFAREGGNYLDISGDIVSGQAAAIRVGSFWDGAAELIEPTEETGNLLLLHGAPQIVGDIINDGADSGAVVYFGVALDDRAPAGYAVAATDLVYAGSFSGRPWQGEVVTGRVRLNGDLNTFANLTVHPGATLGGNTTLTGNLVNYGYVAPGNSIGTIIVAGDYLQIAGATLQLEIGGSQSDLLMIEGDATFDDGALLVLEPIAPILAGDFSLLSVGGSLTGTPQMALADSALLDFTLNSDSHALTLQVDRTAYDAVGATENQREVGAVLDHLLTDASGDLAAVLVNIDGLSRIAEVQQSLNALAPSNYAALPDAAFASMRSFTAALPPIENMFASTATEGTYFSHAQTLLLNAQREGDDGIAGYGINGGGVVGGADRRFGNLLLGGALSYQQMEIDQDDSRSQSQTETVLATLRTAVQLDRWQLQGLLGYGHEWDDSRREIRAAGLSRQAESDGQADILFAGIKSGYRFGGDALALTPVVGVDYAAYGWGGFGESGAEGLNEKIENTTAESLRSSLGVVLAAPVHFGTLVTLDTQLRLGWSHEFADASYSYQARLSGQSFSVRGQDLGRELLSAGLGVQTPIGEKIIAKVGLDYERRRQDDGFAAQVGIIYPF